MTCPNRLQVTPIPSGAPMVVEARVNMVVSQDSCEDLTGVQVCGRGRGRQAKLSKTVLCCAALPAYAVCWVVGVCCKVHMLPCYTGCVQTPLSVQVKLPASPDVSYEPETVDLQGCAYVYSAYRTPMLSGAFACRACCAFKLCSELTW